MAKDNVDSLLAHCYIVVQAFLRLLPLLVRTQVPKPRGAERATWRSWGWRHDGWLDLHDSCILHYFFKLTWLKQGSVHPISKGCVMDKYLFHFLFYFLQFCVSVHSISLVFSVNLSLLLADFVLVEWILELVILASLLGSLVVILGLVNKICHTLGRGHSIGGELGLVRTNLSFVRTILPSWVN